MSERPLEIGEMGILQHLIIATEMNGSIATVIQTAYYNIYYRVKTPTPDKKGRYTGCIMKHQIRRITDPDQTIETEQEAVA